MDAGTKIHELAYVNVHVFAVKKQGNVSGKNYYLQ